MVQLTLPKNSKVLKGNLFSLETDITGKKYLKFIDTIQKKKKILD